MSPSPGAMIVLAMATAVTSWGLVGALGRAARRRGLLDLPNDRSLHTTPTPRLGGLGIGATLILGLALASSLGAASGLVSWPLVASAVAVAIVSLIDDLRGLPAGLRLIVHVLAATAAVASVGYVDAVSVGRSVITLGPAGALVTIVWIVGFINAFNFMDGVDGIAGGQALLAGLAWATIGGLTGEPSIAVLGAVLSAATFGFLLHNWSPARIFMGDVGSALLGFILATVPLVGTAARDLAIPAVLVVWPFIFDTTFTLLRRLGRGENIFAAHRTHLYQRLTQSGWSHAQVSILYAGLAGIGAALAIPIATRALPPAAGPAIVALAAAGLWGLVVTEERRRAGAPFAS